MTYIPPLSFSEKVRKHWTPERLLKITSGKKYRLLPTTAPDLLRAIGLLNQDGSMSADHVRKFIQVNHLIQIFEPHIDGLSRNLSRLIIVEPGCGNSYLSFLLLWAMENIWKIEGIMVGIDSNKSVIEKSRKTAEQLGWGNRSFFRSCSMVDLDWNEVSAEISQKLEVAAEKIRPNITIALHACDTATDFALAFGIGQKSDFIAASPCCQAELARQWKKMGEAQDDHPFAPIFRSAEMRREVGADMTDMFRVLLLRSRGYETQSIEFVPSEHTAKNRLIVATRRGRFLKSAEDEFQRLKQQLGNPNLELEKLISHTTVL